MKNEATEEIEETLVTSPAAHWISAIDPRFQTPAFSLAQLERPAAFGPDVAELNLLARAPLAHVGLGSLDVFVELWNDEDKIHGLAGDDKRRPFSNPPLWFDSLFDGLCILGAEESALHDARAVIDALAFVTADAFVEVHQHSAVSSDAERLKLVRALGLAALLRPTL